MNRNHTMMQFFEWHVDADGTHWKRLTEAAPKLKESGIDCIWIPPITKGHSVEDKGYGVYDVYDLGEFNQRERYVQNMERRMSYIRQLLSAMTTRSVSMSIWS